MRRRRRRMMMMMTEREKKGRMSATRESVQEIVRDVQ